MPLPQSMLPPSRARARPRTAQACERGACGWGMRDVNVATAACPHFLARVFSEGENHTPKGGWTSHPG